MGRNGFELARAAWSEIEKLGREQLKLPELRIQSLGEFFQRANAVATSAEDKRTIVDQAIRLLESFYVHRPFKQERFGGDPIGQLRDLRSRLDQLSEVQFHACVLEAFADFRDAHTLYRLPPPFRHAVAFLPFQMECFADENGQRRFVVTRLLQPALDWGPFQPGAEILLWGEHRPEEVAMLYAPFNPGANQAARFARAVARMTVQPLSNHVPYHPMWETHGPMAQAERAGAGHDPESVALQFAPPDGSQVLSIVLPWGVAEGAGLDKLLGDAGSSTNMPMAQLNKASSLLFCPERMRVALSKPASAPVVPTMPALFEVQFTGGAPTPGEDMVQPDALQDPANPGKRFGYVRIRAFAGDNDLVDQQGEIAASFRLLLEALEERAPDGLIIDVRGNPGGNIAAAERLLQMLTPQQIVTASFHFANTPEVSRMFRTTSDLFNRRSELPVEVSNRIVEARAELRLWLDESAEVIPNPDPHLTTGRRLTARDAANDSGQIYHGPVALLIDALTYSAADIFAAGFQDHRIGPVIGVDPNTGGGGANRWRYQELRNTAGDVLDPPLPALPGGVNMTVAIRRSGRVGPGTEGQPVEDTGVQADLTVPLTRNDLFHSSRDLLRRVCAILASLPSRRLRIVSAKVAGEAVEAEIETEGIDRLELLADASEPRSAPALPGRSAYTVPLKAGMVPPFSLRVSGFSGDMLVVAARTLVMGGG